MPSSRSDFPISRGFDELSHRVSRRGAGRVRHVQLLAMREILEFDGEESRRLGFGIVAQQAAEDGVRVELWHTRPYHRAPTVNKRGNLAIACKSEIKIGQLSLHRPCSRV